MGAELSRKRGGKKTRTSMSESQLEEFASKELDTSFIGDEAMEKNVIKSITKYLGKQENGFPPTKGERREAKRVKAKKMKVTGAGAKISQRIIGEKAAAAGGVDKQLIKAISAYLKEDTPKYRVKPTEANPTLLNMPKPPKTPKTPEVKLDIRPNPEAWKRTKKHGGAKLQERWGSGKPIVPSA